MDRRRFLLTSLAGVLGTPLVAESQQAGKMYRIGLLSWGPRMSAAGAFVDEMRALGYVEGQNLTMEYRWAAAFERLPQKASTLAQSPFDALVVVSTPAALAAKNATKTIPVVMAASADPVGGGVGVGLAVCPTRSRQRPERESVEAYDRDHRAWALPYQPQSDVPTDGPGMRRVVNHSVECLDPPAHSALRLVAPTLGRSTRGGLPRTEVRR